MKNSLTVTSIQAQCWPVAFKGRDLLAVVQDGTEAKAAAYLVPAMAHLFSQPPFKCANGPVALFLVPNREVAREVHKLACEIQEYTKVGVACICCRDPRQPQLEQLEERPQVCIATPGRLLAFLKEGRLNLRRCTCVVFDGLDYMVDVGLEDEVRAIVDWMPPGRQTQIWLNSRTRNMRLLCEDLLDDYVQVSIGVKMVLSDQNVEQIAIVCDEAEKNDRLLSVLQDILNESSSKVIVFVETKRTVDDVATLLLLREWPVIGVHGKKKDDKLDWAFTTFRDNWASVLVCTDVCARKLDAAADVRYVINYDYPGSSEVYKRRLEHVSGSGRTAVAYTLFTPKDKRYAGHFMSILLEAKQVVPPELRDMAKGTVRNRKLGVGRTGERRVP
ncbi:probable ATP-dependent RNA helicase DDX5 [Rhipicephalus sanguineus]|nr:probable ATP-dependent RNA helicase DDX5 [Rhipicephalus sanguineus]